MELRIKNAKCTTNLNGDVSLNFAISGANRLTKMIALEQLITSVTAKNKELQLVLKEWFAPRSLSANAYFHVLVNKIAEKIQAEDDEVKMRLVVSYGALDVDRDGKYTVMKLPESVNVTNYYSYAKYIGSEVDSAGKVWNMYIAYKETHRYNRKEMARLIEGTIDEANRLGIETKTPREVAEMVALLEEQ
jgi:hypothetical protein